MRKTKKHLQSEIFDKKFLFLSLFLTIAGLVSLADASAPLAARTFGDTFYFLKQQLIWALIGVALLFVTMKIRTAFSTF